MTGCKTANNYDVVGAMSALPHRYLPTARLLDVPSDIRNPSSWTCQPASESHDCPAFPPLLIRATPPLTIRTHGRPSTRARKHSLHVVGSYCANRVSFLATLESKTGHTLLHQCAPVSTGVFPPPMPSVFKS